ncbi:MAG: protein kinase [Myxococcota bacterium]
MAGEDSTLLRGRYRLGEPLARDEGTGEYWSAFDTFLERGVTIKRLPKGVTERLLRRYEREARILGALEHAALPRVFDADLTEDAPFLVMEALHAKPMTVALDAAMSPASALVLVEELGDALELAHARGFLHRRVSPEHVLLTAEGTPKLIGFGRASLGGSRSTTTSDIQSSPSAYLSPELFSADGRDVRTDVYGLGTVLLYALTLRPPVDLPSGGFAFAMRALMSAPRLRLSQLGSADDALDRALASALALDPARRPPTVRGWLRELQQLAPLEDDASLLGAELAGRYRIERRLGRGAHGAVFLAHDGDLQRDVAIKFVRDEAKALLDEARAMAQVTHGNVVQVFDVGRHQNRPYLVMENVPGETVEERIERGPLPLEEAVSIVAQLALGSDAIHRAGLVHGDIKPSNALVGPSYRVCLTDFGLVRTAQSWATSDVGGTPAYFAPERAARRVRPGLAPRIDVYSLAIMAFELLTGRLPFEGTNPIDVIREHASAPIPRPSRDNEALEPFDDVVRQGLAKDPEQRTASARAFRVQLLEAHASLGKRLRAAPRFLIVDPSAAAERIGGLLRSRFSGASVDLARSAREAVARLKYQSYSALLFDLDLPDENGLEFAASLRADVEGAPPLIAVTGAGTAADWQVLAALGVQAFLFKPVDEEQLAATLLRVLD